MEKIKERQNEAKILSSRTVNQIGNVMYDYGNSTWIAGLGMVSQKYMGYYQLAENLISLILNPIGGAVADRFQRRRILLVTDFIGGVMCLLLAFVGRDDLMLYGLIAVNGMLAILHAFAGTSFRSYVATIVDKERLVSFNAKLEMISQVVSISSPLFAYLYVDRFGLRPTLILDSITFFLSFLLLFSIREKELIPDEKGEPVTVRGLLADIWEGLVFVWTQKDVFFLLVVASLVNFFIAAFNYLAPFSNVLLDNASGYATMLTMGAAGAMVGAAIANRIFKNSYKSMLLSLGLCGVGLMSITLWETLKMSIYLITSGNLIFECFLTIFNIHFFSLVQKKVPNHMLGRVFSSIFTVAIILMPVSTAIMTLLPGAVHIGMFAVIGAGVIFLSVVGYLVSKRQ